MREGARLYIEQGIEPGSFMVAILSNDLMGAFQRADHVNVEFMRHWADWLYNDCPMAARGKPERVENWIVNGGMKGLMLRADKQFGQDSFREEE
jgi:hypothetical protein